MRHLSAALGAETHRNSPAMFGSPASTTMPPALSPAMIRDSAFSSIFGHHAGSRRCPGATWRRPGHGPETQRAAAPRQSKPRLVERPGLVGFDDLVDGAAYAANEFQAQVLAVAQSVRAHRAADNG